MQVVITPIHLLGLNFYNAPSAAPAQRVRAVWSTCPESTAVRMLRFTWAYGVGGLVNKELSQRARDWTVSKYASVQAIDHSKESRPLHLPSSWGLDQGALPVAHACE